MRWLQNFIAYIDIQQLVGESNDFYRPQALRLALKGSAQDWFHDCVIGPDNEGYAMFEETLQRLALRFLKPLAITKVQNQFDNAKYSWETRTHEFVENLKRISKHLFLEVDAFTLRKEIIKAIPADMRRTIINIKGLSTTTSSVKEWVAAIDRRECEILEYEAFEEGNRQRMTPYSNTQTCKRANHNQRHIRATNKETRPTINRCNK